MLIFSRDRKKMIDCVSVQVTRNFGGGKDGKFGLIAYGGGLGSMSYGVIASFSDERLQNKKNLMDELEKMFTAFESGAQAYRL